MDADVPVPGGEIVHGWSGPVFTTALPPSSNTSPSPKLSNTAALLLSLPFSASTTTRGHFVDYEAVWNLLTAFSNEVRIFYWRATHEALKTGEYFTRMQKEEIQLQGYCTICGQHVLDTLEHILLECNDPARAQIWGLVRTLWAHKNQKWFDLSYGLEEGSRGNYRAC
ncbi:hypothetical protein EXIGLDRAFT_781851 [Exidia glandulosa HHB12029]|uniref:Reverse transcriptase zinc-binding domain-containing protein n=1 Tax=Exidia glandulosa HHB12029 TaxID=1314781 RepID=A0A165Z6D7_EXIGL|nr:hypothetical protein EXIGLDRAFT_781851 [Exidia glandulosa HHB12029]